VKAQVRRHATTLGDVVGAGLLSVGAALIYMPAGLIVSGALILAASWAEAGRRDAP